MKRPRALLPAAALVLVVGAVLWLALRGDAPAGRGAAGRGSPAEVQEVRPAAKLAQPAGAPTPAGEPPAGERIAVAHASPATPASTVVIQDARGEPAAGVPWAIFHGAGVLASGTTAADGSASFAPGQGEAELAAVPPDHPPQVFALDLAGDQQVVTLAGGAAVAGVILIDGLPPPEPFKLRLALEQEPLSESALPEQVWQALGLPARAVKSLATATGPGGSFRFGGLPAGCPGMVRWSGPFNLAAEEAQVPQAKIHLMPVTSLAVVAPAEDLVVRLESTPRIIGRVVRPDTGEPIARADVSLAWSDDRGGVDASGSAEEDGSFEFSVLHRLPARIELIVADRERAGARRHELQIPPGVSTFDAGALAILTTRTLDFLVRDVEGAPIEGATARELPDPPGRRAEGRTDAEGRGALQVASHTQALRFVALGYEPLDAPVPAGSGPLEVTLRPGTVLEVRILPAAADLGLQVRGTEPPFLNDGNPSWIPEPSPPRSGRSVSGGGGFTTAFTGAKDGRYVLNGVRPGISLALAVIDAHTVVVLGHDVPPLAPGERRVVELAVSPERRALAGRVRSADGVPLPRASVMVGQVGSPDLGGWGRGASVTDPEGRFRLEGITVERVRLVVTHADHAPLLVAEQPVVEEPPLELVLDRGRMVRVAVHGPDGKPVPGATARLSAGEPPWTIVQPPTASELLVFEHAPREALLVTVTAGNRPFERTLAAGSAPEEVDVLVPAWQSCTVHLSGTPEALAQERLYVELETSGHSLRRFPGKGASEALFEVVFSGRYEAHAGVWPWSEDAGERRSETVAFDVTAAAPARATLEVRGP